MNPSKAVDEGYFGTPKKGVNVTRYVDYALKVWLLHVTTAVIRVLCSTRMAWSLFSPATK